MRREEEQKFSSHYIDGCGSLVSSILTQVKIVLLEEGSEDQPKLSHNHPPGILYLGKKKEESAGSPTTLEDVLLSSGSWKRGRKIFDVER